LGQQCGAGSCAQEDHAQSGEAEALQAHGYLELVGPAPGNHSVCWSPPRPQ
jgi:hypothetical protein